MRSSLRRALLIRRKALGDSVVTVPAVRALRDHWPEARLDLVVDRPFAPLLEALLPDVNVVVWPPVDGGLWWPRLAAARYDLVVDWLGSPRTALWTALSGARVRVGYDLPRRRWAYNLRVPRNRVAGLGVTSYAGEAFLDPLRSLGLLPEPWRPAAVRPAEDGLGERYRRWRDGFLATDGAPVALAMSATWPAKAWPASHAAELYSLLADRGLAPLFVTGPGDEDLEGALRELLPSAAFAPPTNLVELADLLGRARLFVGTDNGMRHVATAAGTGTVTLFGPTDPEGWNPASARHVAVTNGTDCAPCDLTECPVAGHPCLDGLSARRVLAAVAARLEHEGGDRGGLHAQD